MPIYEYECLGCRKISEFIERVAGEMPEKICKHCGGVSLNKTLSKGVTSRMNGIIGAKKGRTCCGREERCGDPPCDELGSCCR
jgi:putative FmdB family regulatory protein